MRDHNFRPGFDFIFYVPLFCVSDQSLRRAVHVREVHRVRADTGKLRSIVRSSVAALGLRHDLSDGAPAKSAGPKLERFVKAIIQLIPVSASDQFIDHARIKIGRRAVD